ncbi:DNA-binding transcriptional regulator, LysR family [Marinobacter daqiaonensis]|uniref:DNA-binding transcriptional regulator, LysR family n=1 Tax=Marinobacter daqiaonensis TaxID=650891 RepID=A0A1I6GWD4_9GAMM|nr:LysR family transcriptional regulator [Marinobacter daqiaonensis]SFR46498.1 DNA-binding transcriptional regulator, LysR family [Marinobacter daqiaonensis]
MDSNALKAFVTIIDQGSFSEAAETLHLTQPAISKRLAALENQLGTPLLERSHRQIRLTDAGARLLPHARRILDEVHNARLSLQDRDGVVSGQLSLIASHHIGLHHLPGWLQRLSQGYPEVSLTLQFMDSEGAYDQMRKRTAELAFVTLSESMDQSFEVHARWRDEMAFVVSPDHPLASMESPDLRALSGYDALLPEAGTATYRSISRLFLDADLPLNLPMPTNYLETLKVMTGVGLGWSVLPVSMVDDTLRVLPLSHRVSRYLGAIGLRGRTLSPQARALLGIAGEIR